MKSSNIWLFGAKTTLKQRFLVCQAEELFFLPPYKTNKRRKCYGKKTDFFVLLLQIAVEYGILKTQRFIFPQKEGWNMNMKYTMRIAAMLLLSLLTACTARHPNVREIPETADTYYAYQDGLADWLTPEENYIYDSDGDSSDGIVRIGWQRSSVENCFFRCPDSP